MIEEVLQDTVEAKDPYYFRPEVSNSDLSALQKMFMPPQRVYDIETAYAFGTLLDCFITEIWKVNFFKRRCAGRQYSSEEFALAEEMKKSFYRDPMCRTLAEHSDFQKIIVRPDFKITWDHYTIPLPMRCKFDLYAAPRIGINADIKSTTAKTLSQFEGACEYFSYFRQRAVYMDLSGCDKDMLIGVSKVNQQVFKIPIVRNDKYYNLGKAQYSQLGFQYWSLFDGLEF